MIDIHKDPQHTVIPDYTHYCIQSEHLSSKPTHQGKGEEMSLILPQGLPGTSVHGAPSPSASHILHLTHLAILWGESYGFVTKHIIHEYILLIKKKKG